jgi:hypothetical protein
VTHILRPTPGWGVAAYQLRELVSMVALTWRISISCHVVAERPELTPSVGAFVVGSRSSFVSMMMANVSSPTESVRNLSV